MPENELAVNPALEEARRRRADLHAALITVEQVISGPAFGRENDWSKEVLLSLENLGRAIDEHIEVTERESGLYEEVTRRAPHLSPKIERLAEEHPAMRDETAAMRERLRATPIGDAWPLEQARNDLQRLLGKVVKHRQLGADLVWEAYNLDIGGIE